MVGVGRFRWPGCLILGVLSLLVGGNCASAAAYTEEVHSFAARDGWGLKLTRFRPPVISGKKEPLVILHGFASNRYCFHLPNASLPEYLVGQGYDVWLAELRGHGRSDKPEWLNPGGYNWGVDEYIQHDAPAIIDEVRRLSGWERVFLIGHSMGGMIGYAYCQTDEAPKLKGLVTIGSPGKFGGSTFIVQFMAAFEPLFRVFPVVYSEAITTALVPVSGLGDSALGATLWNYQNISTQAIADLARYAVDNVSTKVIRDFLDWENNSEFRRRDGSYSYRDGLPQVVTPCLLLAGEGDGLGVRANVEYAFQNISSPDKTFVNFATSNGYVADYGHLDLLVGQQVALEVYPVIAQWLSVRDGDNEVSSRLTSHRNGQRVSTLTLTLAGIASERDGAGIGSVEVSTDGGQTWLRPTLQDRGGLMQWELPWTAPAAGSYTIVSRATDNFDNVQETFYPITLSIELPTPTPSPSPTPTQTAPPRASILGGWMETRLSTRREGYCTFLVLVPEYPGYEAAVSINGLPTALRLKDDGRNGDLAARDAVCGWSFPVKPGLPPAEYLVALTIYQNGERGSWPFLTVTP